MPHVSEDLLLITKINVQQSVISYKNKQSLSSLC